MAADLANTDITRNFDLVGFDPRGVGHSTPRREVPHRRRVRRFPARPHGRLQPVRWWRTSSRSISSWRSNASIE